MIKKYTILFTLLTLAICNISAANADTLQIYSKAMDKNINCVVITPKNYNPNKPLPVVYLLHGHGDNHTSWIRRFNIMELVDQYSIIAVCPDGDTSWYWDSPVNPKMKYETFVANELISYIDKNYATIANKSGRAISGLSMGGHGALFLAIRHQNKFGAAGSMSGGVDIRPFPNNWNMAKWLGSKNEKPNNWETHTVINQLHLLKDSSLKLIIDCGTEDFFYDVNVDLHNKLLSKKIPHTYISAPGAHNINYWGQMLPHHIMFFDTFFRE